MPYPTSETRKERIVWRARAATQVPIMLSRRQYGWLTVAVCLVLGLLLLPAITAFRSQSTLAERGILFVITSVGVVLQMGLNYGLRYGDNPLRRWLDRRELWFNILLRIAIILSATAALSRLHAQTQAFWGGHTEWRQHAVAGSQIFAFIVVFIQLAVEALERGQYLTSENERLHQEQLRARYEGLKQQLSPHFLFNSLSTLRGLIEEDPAAAGQFVTGMSAVYRYLLRHGEQLAVPLHEEVAFVRAYCSLLQMRFGESLHLRLDLPAAIQERRLPPLALQLLVENAVKHNVLTRRQPMCITIEFQAPDTLLVRNTLQPHSQPEPSSGLGISNLATRVRLLHHRELLIDKTADTFSVYLPLPA